MYYIGCFWKRNQTSPGVLLFWPQNAKITTFSTFNCRSLPPKPSPVNRGQFCHLVAIRIRSPYQFHPLTFPGSRPRNVPIWLKKGLWNDRERSLSCHSDKTGQKDFPTNDRLFQFGIKRKHDRHQTDNPDKLKDIKTVLQSPRPGRQQKVSKTVHIAFQVEIEATDQGTKQFLPRIIRRRLLKFAKPFPFRSLCHLYVPQNSL